MREIERTAPNAARAAAAYPVAPRELLAAARRAVERLPRWPLESCDENELRAVRRTRVFRFADEVVVRAGGTAGGSRAELESASRIGAYDLGQNRRNLLEFLDAVGREIS